MQEGTNLGRRAFLGTLASLFVLPLGLPRGSHGPSHGEDAIQALLDRKIREAELSLEDIFTRCCLYPGGRQPPLGHGRIHDWDNWDWKHAGVPIEVTQ